MVMPKEMTLLKDMIIIRWSCLHEMVMLKEMLRFSSSKR